MKEPGEIRRREDGTFEYLKTTTMSLRGGYVEQWESACEHAARHMRLPAEFEARLRAAGYRGGGSLFDLLIAEGWKRPQRSYVELGPDEPDVSIKVIEVATGEDVSDRYVAGPAFELDSGEASEATRVSKRAAEFIEPPKPPLGS